MLKLLQITSFFFFFAIERTSVLEAQDVPTKATSPDLRLAKPRSAAGEEKEVVSSETQVRDNWVERTKRVLEIGVAGLTTAKQKAELHKLIPKAEDDPRYGLAFVLVAMKEKQWASALKNITEILERHQDYLPARVAHARLLLSQDKKLAAVAELERLAKGLSTSSEMVSSDQLAFAARFLGLAVGYLEGPSKESIKPTTLQALIAETDKITPSHQVPFSQARLSVASEYETLVEKGEKALEELRQGLVEDTQEKRNELESQRAKTAAEADAARKQLESNWAIAATNWNVVWSTCVNLRQNANGLQIRRGSLATSIATLREPIVDKNGNVDRNDERRYRDEKRRLDIELSIIDGQLNRLSTEFEVARRNGMAIEVQMNALQVQAKRLGMTLASMSGSFAQADQFLKAKEKSAKKVETKLSGSKLRQARAFSTYDDFNFHKEQSLLIDTLPKD